MNDQTSEALRLEKLWGGEFGDAYTERNREIDEAHQSFWTDMLKRYPTERILEVGCNLGINVHALRKIISAQNVYGIDVNQKALGLLHTQYPDVNAVWSPARELPFRDRWFDTVFTMGVLIHQPDDSLPLVMSEIVRCSRRFVLCDEYFAEERAEVPYRDQQGALIKRNFGQVYQSLFPNLQLREQLFLSRAQNWDDITVWVFEKTGL